MSYFLLFYEGEILKTFFLRANTEMLECAVLCRLVQYHLISPRSRYRDGILDTGSAMLRRHHPLLGLRSLKIIIGLIVENGLTFGSTPSNLTQELLPLDHFPSFRGHLIYERWNQAEVGLAHAFPEFLHLLDGVFFIVVTIAFSKLSLACGYGLL